MAAGPVLTAEGLVVARAGRVLVEGFDLELARGELVAVLGPNGVGK
jgi:ABC-type hemin transport system ATPase subunit